MARPVLACFLIALVLTTALARPASSPEGAKQRSKINNNHALMKVVNKDLGIKQVGFDYCGTCVSFMGQFINQILNIILNAGVLGSCNALCSQLPESWEQVICDLLCSYIGIEAFIKLVEYEDPDAIYACQVLTFCNHTDGGEAQITKAYVQPPSGPVGSTFLLGFNFHVSKQTSVGLLTATVVPPLGFPLSGDIFTEGFLPGDYNVEWNLRAQPSEDDPFTPGLYKVYFDICYGDCTGKHKWSGVYDKATTNFTITH